MSTFSAKLKSLRGNMKQAEFARKIGVAQNSYNRYESGERVPDTTVLSQMASRLRVSTDWLLGLTDDNKSSASAPVADKIAERSGVGYNSSSACDQKDLTIANQAESIVNLSRSLVQIVNQQEPKGKNKNAKKQ